MQYPTDKAILFLTISQKTIISHYTIQLMDSIDPIDKLTERIALVEMEIGFLRSVRRSTNPMHSIVAGEVEIDRKKEIDRLRGELKTLQLSA